MTPSRFLAILFTITTTIVVYGGYHDAPDAVRWATLYVVVVVVPWVLVVLHRRRGVTESIAVELLLLPQLTAQVATTWARRPPTGALPTDWPTLIPPLVGLALIVVTYWLARSRVVR